MKIDIALGKTQLWTWVMGKENTIQTYWHNFLSSS